MSENKKILPIVALRGMTVLPDMLIHFDINRKITISAIEQAMLQDQMVVLVSQKDAQIDTPEQEDLHEIGTLALIKQVIKLPNDVIRVMVSSMKRAHIDDIVATDPFLNAAVTILDDAAILNVSELEKKAMMQIIRDLLEIYAQVNDKMPKGLLQKLLAVDNIESLLDEVGANLPLDYETKQEILNQTDPIIRYDKIALILSNEIELVRIKKAFQEKVKAKVDQNQKEYLLREQLKVIREELGDSNPDTDAENYQESMLKLKAPKEVKDKIKKEIDRFRSIGMNSSENSVIRGYIETLLELPWNKISKDNNDIKRAAKVLDEDHYGLRQVKDRILEFLAVRSLTSKGDAPIICLVGPPGTGKTSIARSVARALDKKYLRISLGGVRDEAEIRGHRRTYVGAMPGRIVAGLKNVGVKNPLMLLDEIDKVSSDYKGDTASALLEVLDLEQNDHFNDHYVELPVDLSEVLFIATANSIQTIPKPLLDRMELIEVSSYTQVEKMHIAKEHLISKQIKRNGLKSRQVSIASKALELIISGYTREAGVRNLERKIGEICRKSARQLMEEDKKQIKITEKNIDKYLGNPKYTFDEKNDQDEVGIVRGLAWTSVGGDTLQIEVNVMSGKGTFELTGQLGDVMKESAKTGISYIRSVCEQYQIKSEYFGKNDIHIHIPEGSVPKDGPSAGITMATAMLSAITQTKVHADIAMTGEITLRGRVLPIGGLKEKILAAKAAKIKTVLVPKKNMSDIEEITEEIKEGIKIKYVETMQEVLSYAFVKEEEHNDSKEC